ncbi:MAG: hypothetical protein M1814_002492 [Vezdaea aestivalis]|nr:MAG: hypothetical protein M1814_002492 [Vezdaea aestivalis]
MAYRSLTGLLLSFKGPRRLPKAFVVGKTSRKASSFLDLPVLKSIATHSPDNPAIVHSGSRQSFSYGQLLSDVTKASLASEPRAIGAREAILGKNNYDFVVNLLSAFAKRSIAVPLSPSFPPTELGYVLSNSGADTCYVAEEFKDLAQQAIQTVSTDCLIKDLALHLLDPRAPQDQRSRSPTPKQVGPEGGLIIYTSGTTSRPKGVYSPLETVAAQANSVIQAWNYGPKDRLLHCLPLHHIHGIINGLIAPLMAGATIEFLFPFNALGTWERLAAPFLSIEAQSHPVSIFTAVPTIYDRLLNAYGDLSSEIREAATLAVSPENLRLNMSGSAALPSPLQSRWAEVSRGNLLLERYGMTEVGMALSCGLAYKDRVDGSVGWPLPGVEARLVESGSGAVISDGEEVGLDGIEREGEVQLRGPSVFKEYWQNKEATASEFVADDQTSSKWFKTGDIAVRREVSNAGQSTQEWARGPMYFIKGRKSVDIIKSGGEKISALEVEREILALPEIADVAVVGIDSPQWGQVVAAVLVMKQSSTPLSKRSNKKWSIMDLRCALKDRLAKHKMPQKLRILEDLPRNAMGKGKLDFHRET